MLSKLNDEQIRLIDEVKDEFIGLLDKKINEKDAIEGVEFVYKLAGLKSKVIILDSPLACQKACQKLYNQVQDSIGNQIGNQLGYEVGIQIWNRILCEVNNQVDIQVKNWVWNKVGNPFWNQIRVQVMNVLRSQIKDMIRNRADNGIWNRCFIMSLDGVWSIGWTAFYSYFKKIGIVDNELFDKYEKYIKSGVFTSIYFENLAILSRNPTKLSKDEICNLHSVEGYAIEWMDGYGQYYVDGVYFDSDLFDKFFIKKNITSEEIANLKNDEQRICLIEYVE